MKIAEFRGNNWLRLLWAIWKEIFSEQIIFFMQEKTLPPTYNKC